MSDEDAKGTRMDLEGELAGHYIVLNPGRITMGFFEDLEQPLTGPQLEALASVLVGSNLPNGHDKAGLRKLKPKQFAALCNGVSAALRVPKNA